MYGVFFWFGDAGWGADHLFRMSLLQCSKASQQTEGQCLEPRPFEVRSPFYMSRHPSIYPSQSRALPFQHDPEFHLFKASFLAPHLFIIGYFRVPISATFHNGSSQHTILPTQSTWHCRPSFSLGTLRNRTSLVPTNNLSTLARVAVISPIAANSLLFIPLSTSSYYLSPAPSPTSKTNMTSKSHHASIAKKDQSRSNRQGFR